MINITIKQSQQLPGILNAFITFAEYNERLINKLRTLKDRRYNAENKTWEIPLSDLEYFIGAAKEYPINITLSNEKTEFIDIPKDYKFKTIPFQHQIDGIRYGLNHDKFILADEQGLGKALDLDTKIYTPNGYKLMRDIQVGDIIFTDTGKTTRVTNTYYHRNVEMYKITFSDGTSIKCCKDHLWEIYDQHGKKIVDTKWFFQKNQFGKQRTLRGKYGYKYYVPLCKPIEFLHQTVPIHPYLLGILLGDGLISGTGVGICTADTFIIDYLKTIIPAECCIKQNSKYGYRIVKNDTQLRINIIKQQLKQLGLMGTKSNTKFVPDCYLYNDIETRTELLRGLLDTDSWEHDNHVEYYTTSPYLRDAVKFLVESLGGFVTIRSYIGKYNNKLCKPAWTLCIKYFNPQALFRLPRRKNKCTSRHFLPRRNIVNIERIPNSDAKCITVDSPSHLYICEHFIVTHNTATALNLACIRKQVDGIKQCLVICGVNSIKYNWENEVKTHTNESVFVLGTRYKENGKRKVGNSVADRIEDLKTHNEFFLITNIETLRNDDFIKQVNKMSDKIQMIIFDEFHLCRNSNSAQTKGLFKLYDFKYKMALSGTPIVNRPLDAYVGLKWLGLEKVNFSTFRRFYCETGGVSGHQLQGYRNLSKLRESLAHNMLRRLKTDVLDLPDKIEKIEYVEMSEEQWKIYDEIRQEILENIDLIVASNNPLTHLLRLRQATGDTSLLSSTVHISAKLERIEQIVDEIAENGRKCVIFSNWSQMTERIRDKLKRFNPAYITGEVKDVDREAEKQKFANDNTCKVCIGTIGALGTGHTLIAADTVIFADLPFTYSSYSQACDRIHRIGQTHTVNIIKLLCIDTIDERMDNLIIKKKNMSEFLVDGKAPKLGRQDILNLIS